MTISFNVSLAKNQSIIEVHDFYIFKLLISYTSSTRKIISTKSAFLLPHIRYYNLYFRVSKI